MGKDSHKKARKKKNKKEKKRHKSKRNSSSSSSSSEEEIWEEAPVTKSKERLNTQDGTNISDDWINKSDDIFSTFSRIEKRKPKPIDPDERKSTIENLGQSDRELNPYWKNGGTGLPAEEDLQQKQIGTVGDMGLDWLNRALARAKERAALEKRSLEDVVAETWGSLEKLYELIEIAKRKARVDSPRWKRTDVRSERERSDYHRQGRDREPSHSKSFRRPGSPEETHRSQSKLDSRESRADHSSKARERSRGFMRPDDGNSSQNHPSKPFLERDRSREQTFLTAPKLEKRSGWKKNTQDIPKRELSSGDFSGSSSQQKQTSSVVSKESPPAPEEKPDILSKEEMNKLGAKVIKAEIMGDMELAKSLKEKLRKAQSWLEGSKVNEDKQSVNEVLLTQTDSKGFSRPVAGGSAWGPSRAKKTKVDTHSDGKRVRYFADDDKHSLQDLYHQEKFISASDQNEMYSRMASKGVGRDDSARDMEDIFEETARVDKGEEWSEFRAKQRAVQENSQREKVLDSCQRCFTANPQLRHLIVSIMDKVYLCVPPYHSITDGHCLIIPTQHSTCSTLLDEDVWEEILDLRKMLVNMFIEEEKDVIFYENARFLKKFPHMVIHCVPVPIETGDVAPIYFKKALLECETEWSNNKKVVDLKGRDVRKAVPKGLPYFSVDFGMQSGYAHVIEDEQLFPKNFAEEIIGGMLDLDHSLWRKQKKDDLEIQHDKAQQLIKKFKAFTSRK